MPEHALPAKPERVFGEPWHAHVFAFAVQLSEAGYFAWSEWGEHFGARLKRAATANDSTDDARSMPQTDSATYYDVWLDALESLLIQRGLASTADLVELQEAWAEAYLRTPHGMPVGLGGDGDHNHAHSQDTPRIER